MSETIEQSAKRAWIEVATLREQVEKLTKERDIKEHCIVQLEAEDLRAKEQLAPLAEQNEKMRDELREIVDWMRIEQAPLRELELKSIARVLSLPDLASPVLNRIRAEGMREAINLYSPDDSAQDWIDKISARAAELEKTND